MVRSIIKKIRVMILRIFLDPNYYAIATSLSLGYVGETGSRKITVEGYKTDGADLYKLRLSMPDKAEYEVDISSGEYTIPASLLSTAGYVRLQVLAVKANDDGSYEYVKKSNILSGIRIEESLNGKPEPVPTYEDAVGALDKVLAAVDMSAENAEQTKGYAESAENAKDIAVAKTQEISSSAEQINQNTADILMLYNKADGIVCETEGKEIRLADSSNLGFNGMRIFGQSTQEGTPSPNAPVPITSVGDSGTVTVTISDNSDTQSLILQTSDGLLGISLNSGAKDETYTDEDGIRWQCDEVDLCRGVCVKRVGDILLDGENLLLSRSGNPLEHTLRYACKLPSKLAARTSNVRCLSPSLPWVYSYWADEEHQYVQGEMAFVFIDSARLDGFADINDYLKAYPIRIIYPLQHPMETSLTEEQLAEYKSLHTYKPATVIANSDNAYMEIAYTADTKAYIDNKFAELTSAIISTGGNV